MANIFNENTSADKAEVLKQQRALQDNMSQLKHLQGKIKYCEAAALKASTLTLRAQESAGCQALEPSINTARKGAATTKISALQHSTRCGNNRDTLENTT